MTRDPSFFVNGDIAWDFHKFPIFCDITGELGVVELSKEFDFKVKRIFFLRNIENGKKRGFHSHKKLKQLIICVNGSFVIKLDNGKKVEEVSMIADDTCLFLDGKVWREMMFFSEDAVVLVLCDKEYRFDEVVRDYSSFKENLIGMNHV